MWRSAAPTRFCSVRASLGSAAFRSRAAMTRSVMSLVVGAPPVPRSASMIARPISPLNAACRGGSGLGLISSRSMSGGEDADRGVNVVDVDDELAHPLLRGFQLPGDLRPLADQAG